jgi:hypothetical protein
MNDVEESESNPNNSKDTVEMKNSRKMKVGMHQKDISNDIEKHNVKVKLINTYTSKDTEEMMKNSDGEVAPKHEVDEELVKNIDEIKTFETIKPFVSFLILISWP